MRVKSWRSRWLSELFAEEVLDDVLVEGLVVAVGDHLAGFGLVKGAGFLDEFQEGAAAVVEMGEPVFDFGGAGGAAQRGCALY